MATTTRMTRTMGLRVEEEVPARKAHRCHPSQERVPVISHRDPVPVHHLLQQPRLARPEKSLRVEDAMKLLSDVWNAEMKAAFKHVKQSLLVTGAMMVVGAMVGGPVGLAVGGTVGGFLSFWMSKGKFKSVPQILKELPPAEKEKLHRQVRYIVRNLEWTDVVQLTKKVMANEDVRKQLLTLITGYVVKKL